MIKFEGELLEKMSEFDHEIWKTAKTEEGYHNPSHCPFKNKGQWCRKCNPMFVPYNLLPDDIKELNRIRWRNIHTILNKLGLEIVQKEGEKHVDIAERTKQVTKLYPYSVDKHGGEADSGLL